MPIHPFRAIAVALTILAAGLGMSTPAQASTIAGGETHTCVLHTTGTVSCFGDNSTGALGNPTVTGDSAVPVTVQGISDAVSIGAGSGVSCALHRGGTVSCWGDGTYGEVGDGTNDQADVPVDVLGITDATAISVGFGSACALHADGAVSCWGYNGNGQLGDGTTENRNAPVAVAGLTDAIAIGIRGSVLCVVHADHHVSCVGSGADGRLGDGVDHGPRYVSTTLVDVVGITDATALGASIPNTCAIRSGGKVSCWGSGGTGALGDGGTDNTATTPVDVLGLTGITTVVGGEGHVCAIDGDHHQTCWGKNLSAQVGNNGSGIRQPFHYEGVPDDITDITAGRSHTCVVH